MGKYHPNAKTECNCPPDVPRYKNGVCKACTSSRRKEYYHLNKELQKQKLNAWRLLNLGKRKEQGWKQKGINITHARFLEMEIEQGFACAICESFDTGWNGNWHVDHDHATGTVRGLLCRNCNLMLGNAKDNQSTLVKAILYLKKFQ